MIISPILKNDTDNNININIINKKRTDSSSSSEEVAINNDQSAITNYINKLNYNPSTISVLLKWYDLVAKDRGLTIKQLKYNINSINESTNGNEYEISKAINEAIDNDWMGFYKSQKKEPAYKRLSKQNMYEEEIRKPVILGTEVF